MAEETGPESRARPVGINHVALAVGDVEEALEFYGELFAFDLRGRTESGAFIDMGDQFLALAETDDPEGADDPERADHHRHFGLVVDDRDAVERRLDEVGVEPLSTSGVEFRDPWGNRVQVVAYEDVQFTKADHVLEGMDMADLGKSAAAIEELAEKGMAPDE